MRGTYLPIIPPFGVNNTPVFQGHQEFASFILDIHQAVDKTLYSFKNLHPLKVNIGE